MPRRGSGRLASFDSGHTNAGAASMSALTGPASGLTPRSREQLPSVSVKLLQRV